MILNIDSVLKYFGFDYGAESFSSARRCVRTVDRISWLVNL